MTARIAALCAMGLAVAFLSGCGATGPKYTTPPALEANQARVFFYRMSGLAGGCCAVDFNVNDTKAAAVRSSGYTWLTAEPGHYKIGMGGWADDSGVNKLAFEDDFEAGETYCYRFAAMVGSFSDSSANTVSTNNNLYSAVGPLAMSAALSRIPASDCTKELVDEGYRYTAPIMKHVKPKQ